MAAATKMIGTAWRFDDVWEETFRALPERKLEKRSRIYASELGGSFRDRYLKMHGHPVSNPFNFRSMGKMMAGKFFEDVVGTVLTATGLLKKRQEAAVIELPGMLPVSGKIDFIAGGVTDWDEAKDKAERLRQLLMWSDLDTRDFVLHMVDKILPHFKNIFSFSPAMETIIECKSVSGFVFNLIKSNNKPRRGHDLQALHYLLHQKQIHQASLLYISREDCMLQQIDIERTPEILMRYKKDVATMTEYFNAAGKNYLKNIPPPDAEVIFEESSWNFRKNNLCEYSNFLTYTYGYKNIDEFKDKWDDTLSKWNRVFRRHVLEGKPQGKKGKPLTLTADNIATIAEAKTVFPDWDNYVEQARKAGAFDKLEETEENDLHS